mgnify:FL=1
MAFGPRYQVNRYFVACVLLDPARDFRQLAT